MQMTKATQRTGSYSVLLSYRAVPAWFVPSFIAIALILWSTAYLTNSDFKIFAALKSFHQMTNNGLLHSMEKESSSESSLRVSPSDLTKMPHNSKVDEIESVPITYDQIVRNSQAADRLSALLTILGFASAVLAFAGNDRKLAISSTGIQFPKSMATSLNWKTKRAWEDLTAITMPNRNSPQTIQLLFQIGRAEIEIDRLSKTEQERLFESLDEFAPHCLRSAEFVAYRQKLFSSDAGNSLTQLWEEEMSAHFAATNFVALSPGQSVQGGRIKIIMHLSSGGLSAVYLAEQSKQMVVLKESVLPPGTSAQNREKASQMFEREAQLLMKINHAQIAKVFDHFSENGRDYLLLEYIPGLTLREFIKRNGAQSEPKVLDWTKQITAILQYLHSQNPPIIHRDLTPDNLIITPAGRIVLIDFGAANQFLGTATGTIIGKQFYIAPEQFRGKAEPASDIYSLGASMYFLLTGRDPEALFVAEPAKIVREISSQTNEVVARCTQLALNKRISSAQELMRILLNPTLIGERQTESSDDGSKLCTDDALPLSLKEKESAAIYG